MLKKLFIAVALVATVACGSQNGAKTTQKPDKNFYIYLAFGQSNMEGNARIEDQDREGINWLLLLRFSESSQLFFTSRTFNSGL